MMWTMHEMDQMLSKLVTVEEWWIITEPERGKVNIIVKFKQNVLPDDRYAICKAIFETLDEARPLNTLFVVEDFDILKESLLP